MLSTLSPALSALSPTAPFPRSVPPAPDLITGASPPEPALPEEQPALSLMRARRVAPPLPEPPPVSDEPICTEDVRVANALTGALQGTLLGALAWLAPPVVVPAMTVVGAIAGGVTGALAVSEAATSHRHSRLGKAFMGMLGSVAGGFVGAVGGALAGAGLAALGPAGGAIVGALAGYYGPCD